jgi:mersacidin/lichenicidin family type 2 lantibiotic
MEKTDIIRAWKDAEFRSELSPEERAFLPENPAGLIELTDEALEYVVGGEAADSCMCWSCNDPAPVGPIIIEGSGPPEA